MTSAGTRVGRRSPLVLFLLCALAVACPAQQTAGATLSFDVASVRQNLSPDAPVSSNVPLGPGNVFTPTGGLLTASNFPLITYIAFAYRMTDSQLDAFEAAAPGWVKSEHFDIRARTERAAATKDELRLMMRALLAERFKLAVHYEARQSSVFALTVLKPATTGAGLRVHPPDATCSTALPLAGTPSQPAAAETVAGGYPATCGGIVGLPASTVHRYRIAGRDVSMALLANSFASWGALGRPVVDRTGLTARYDFVLEFIPEALVEAASAAGDGGASFREALKEQLGLRLEAEKAEVQVLVLDGIGHLTPN